MLRASNRSLLSDLKDILDRLLRLNSLSLKIKMTSTYSFLALLL